MQHYEDLNLTQYNFLEIINNSKSLLVALVFGKIDKFTRTLVSLNIGTFNE